jgi:hypothetical protein
MIYWSVVLGREFRLGAEIYLGININHNGLGSPMKRINTTTASTIPIVACLHGYVQLLWSLSLGDLADRRLPAHQRPPKSR